MNKTTQWELPVDISLADLTGEISSGPFGWTWTGEGLVFSGNTRSAIRSANAAVKRIRALRNEKARWAELQDKARDASQERAYARIIAQGYLR